MTREEAIQKIQNDLKLHHDYLSSDYRKSLRMAIEALQQPEIIMCKDCKHWDGVDTCDVIDAPVWDNDFCSMAERRSDE